MQLRVVRLNDAEWMQHTPNWKIDAGACRILFSKTNFKTNYTSQQISIQNRAHITYLLIYLLRSKPIFLFLHSRSATARDTIETVREQLATVTTFAVTAVTRPVSRRSPSSD